MSIITKNISRTALAASFATILGFILYLSFFALVMAIPGSPKDGGSGFLLQAGMIIILVDGLLITGLFFLLRFLWRIKIH